MNENVLDILENETKIIQCLKSQFTVTFDQIWTSHLPINRKVYLSKELVLVCSKKESSLAQVLKAITKYQTKKQKENLKLCKEE